MIDFCHTDTHMHTDKEHDEEINLKGKWAMFHTFPNALPKSRTSISPQPFTCLVHKRMSIFNPAKLQETKQKQGKSSLNTVSPFNPVSLITAFLLAMKI